MLIKHRTVLNRVDLSNIKNVAASEDEFEYFVIRDEDTGRAQETHKLRKDLWEDLDQPETITVTVEPGDLLNEKDKT